MFGYYYAALMTIFLLFGAPGAVGSYTRTVETTKSLPRLTECGRKEQLQIVEAIFDQQKKPFSTSDLIAIYNAADKAAGRKRGDEDAINSAIEKLRQIEVRLGENFTVRYFCVSGDEDAVNPCRHSETMNRTSMRSVVFINGAYLKCSRRCILKPSQPASTHDIAWNVLVNQTQSSSFKAAYSTDEGNDWQCLDTRFHKLSTTSDASLHLQFSWKSMLNLTRLWFSFDGVPFNIQCDDVRGRAVPTCSGESTTSVTNTTQPTSVASTSVSSRTNHTPQTAQSDNLTQIITVVVPVAGVVIITIIVAVAVYQVKKQSQDPVRQTNPGTNQSAAVTMPSPPTAGGAFMFHRYSVIQVPPPPETGTADPKEDAEKDNRKRKAYCHYEDDYEEWDFQKIARERAAIQNNM